MQITKSLALSLALTTLSPFILSFLRLAAFMRRCLLRKGRGLPFVLHSTEFVCLGSESANVFSALCIGIADDGGLGYVQCDANNLATSHHCNDDGGFPGRGKRGKEHHGLQKVRDVDISVANRW